MWASDYEMAKAIADQVLARLRPQERKNDAPAPEPARPPKFKSKYPAGSQEWFKSLPKPLTPREAEARGEAIFMKSSRHQAEATARP